MDILLDAYLDRNLGDDLMIRHLAGNFPAHTFYLKSPDKTMLMPFSDMLNIKQYEGGYYDLLIAVGGSMFEIGSTKVIFNRYNTTVREYARIKKQNKRILTIGCNIGRINRRLAYMTIRSQLSKSDLITVRDSYSAKILHGMNINAKCFPDMLFGFNAEKKQQKSGLAISVYRDIRNPGNNFAAYKKYAEISDLFINNTGEKVSILAFDCENENDLSAAHTVYSLMEKKQNAEIIAYTGDYKPLLNAVSSSSSMISTRFHSLVFASLFGVPALPCIYNVKTEHFLEDMEFKGSKLNFSELENADSEEIVSSLISQKGLFAPSKEIIEKIKNESLGHIQALKEYLVN